MPIVQVSILAGRNPERVAAMTQQVTDAVVSSLDVKPETVRVLVYEVPPEHWAVGGRTKEKESG